MFHGQLLNTFHLEQQRRRQVGYVEIPQVDLRHLREVDILGGFLEIDILDYAPCVRLVLPECFRFLGAGQIACQELVRYDADQDTAEGWDSFILMFDNCVTQLAKLT